MPIEVMGLLHGHVDTEEARTLIVTDVSAAQDAEADTSPAVYHRFHSIHRTALRCCSAVF